MNAAAASIEYKAGPIAAGVGLRLPHLIEVAARDPAAGWLEAHPENFLANAHARELLQDVARRHHVALHTVGVSVGSAAGLDRRHLARLRGLVDEIDPFLVSGHLAWSTHGVTYLNDLLPLPFTDETLRLVVTHVDEVQNTLGRRYLVENPASYLGFAFSTLGEAEFLGELTARTGCGLLCDLSNAYLSAKNLGYDVHAYLDALPADAVAELHLGGFTTEADDATPGGELLIDTHAAAIAAPAWDVYAYALRRFGACPTLIEWDNALPALSALEAEAAKADAISARIFDEGVPNGLTG